VLSPAHAGSPLDGLQPSWPEQKLDITLVEPADRSVASGGPITVTISGRKVAYFAVLLADDAGNSRLVLPSHEGEGAQLTPGQARTFPDLDSAESLPADMAPGAGRVYVIASPAPIFAPGTDAADTVNRLSQSIREAAARHVPVTWGFVSLAVRDPAPVKMWPADQVVDYFANRVTRKGAERGLLVEFDFDSDRLKELGQRQLEALSQGLNDPALRGMHFVLEGHTDEKGSDSYNKELSLRRAQTAVDFLVQRHVDLRRLTATGVGKANLLRDSSGAVDEAMSRRVIIRRDDGGAPPP
jgi:outer membrane protein OmpA-like peptidoglycan-associated protein